MDDRTTKLLLRIVRQLPEREQDQFLTALVKAVVAGAPTLVFERFGPRDPRPVIFRGVDQTMPGSGEWIAPTGPTAILPIRLPPELHERLQIWSGEHGFSMAGVARGLVERFLDEQDGTQRRKGSGPKPKS